MTPKLLAKLSIFPKYNLRDIKEINKNKKLEFTIPRLSWIFPLSQTNKTGGLLWLDCV